MRKIGIWGVALAAIISCVTAVSSATIIIYTDEAEWQNALSGQFLTEDFSDEELNPGVTFVSSESGHINPELECYQDVLASQSQNEPSTTWTFEPRITAYGGKWALGGPGGSGNSLAVYIADDSLYVGSIPNSYDGEFWGFISDEPFSSVRLVGGSGTNQQHYCLDDMVYSPLSTSGVGPFGNDPAGSRLSLRMPSPFGTGQAIRVVGDGAEDASVGIFDAQGRLLRSLIATGRREGEAVFHWDGRTTNGREAPLSVLYVRAVGAGDAATRMVVLVR
jgi:hypothetical protein